MNEHDDGHQRQSERRGSTEPLYGSQTLQAVDNFRISGQPLPSEMIRAIGLVKVACASVNRDLGLLESGIHRPLTAEQINALLAAAQEVANGQLDDQFPVDVYQTGSGTSSNMNANEVISQRAQEILEEESGIADSAIHPNDHVNLGQSTNDTFPTAIHVAVGRSISENLVPQLVRLEQALDDRATEWDRIIKIGRTHLADATPIRLGQEFGGFARQIQLSVARAEQALSAVLELPVGGTAVGTGINTHPEFGNRVSQFIARETGLPFVEAANHFEANAQRDALVDCHGGLRTIASTLFNVANNIRWLGSGPRCGLYEVRIPELQPGSSIMPGKVNPVLCESMLQVCARVMGNDQTMTFSGAAGGQFQLNIMMPLMAHTALESVRLLANCTAAFVDLCVAGLQPNEAACEAAVERSLSMVTSLTPHIGYDRASELAKQAFLEGKTIRELCLEQNVMPPAQLDDVLDPFRMTEPR